MSLNETINNLGDSIINLVDKKRQGILGLEQGEVCYDKDVLANVIAAKHSTFDVSKFEVVEEPNITDDGILLLEDEGLEQNDTPYVTNFVKVNTNIDSWFNINCRFIYRNDMRGNIWWADNNLRLVMSSNTGHIALYYDVDGAATSLIYVNGSMIGNPASGDWIDASVIYENVSATKVSRIRLVIKNKKNTYEFTANYKLTESITKIGIGTTHLGYMPYFAPIDLKYFSIIKGAQEIFNGCKTGIDVISPINIGVKNTSNPTDTLKIENNLILSNAYVNSTNQNIYINNVDVNTEDGFTLEYTFYAGGIFDDPDTSHTLGQAPYCFFNSTGIDISNSNNIYNTTSEALCPILACYHEAYRNGFYVRIYRGPEYSSLEDDLKKRVKTNSLRYSPGWHKVTVVVKNNILTQTLDDMDMSGSATIEFWEKQTYDKFCIGVTPLGFIMHEDWAIDINSIKIVSPSKTYTFGAMVPYTLSKTGTKIVNKGLKNGLKNIRDKYGIAQYYTLEENEQENFQRYSTDNTLTVKDKTANGFNGTVNYIYSEVNIDFTKPFKLYSPIVTPHEIYTAEKYFCGLFARDKNGHSCYFKMFMSYNNHLGLQYETENESVMYRYTDIVGVVEHKYQAAFEYDGNGTYRIYGRDLSVDDTWKQYFEDKNRSPINSDSKKGRVTIGGPNAAYNYPGDRAHFDLRGMSIIQNGVLWTPYSKPNFTLPQGDIYSNILTKNDMPSDVYNDLTLGANESTYTAPSDGYFYLIKYGNNGEFCSLVNLTTLIGDYRVASTSNSPLYMCIPAKRGEQIKAYYSATGDTYRFRFYYTEGSKGEK